MKISGPSGFSKHTTSNGSYSAILYKLPAVKKIEFYEMSLTRNPLMGILMILSALFTILSLFDVFDFLGEQNVKLITAVCYLVIAYEVGVRQFFYRNHVQWNKRGINIRVNEFWGKNFSFSRIRKVLYAEDEYTVITSVGSRKTINLQGIDTESKSKLLNILRSHT